MFGALAWVVLCATVVLAQAPAASSGGESFRKQVAAIASGADTAARRAAITKRLDELGIKYRLEPFKSGAREGTNIIAELARAAGQKELMLGAHYDRVAAGTGAIDNASGSATVLELLAVLKARPLKNYAVTAGFFDLEEIGLVGSRAHVAARDKSNLPALFINFDVFGYGDTLWAGTRDAAAGAGAAVAKSTGASKFPARVGPDYPPSDHVSFVRAGVESLSFSLIDGKEIPGILAVFYGGSEPLPRVMKIIHTPDDTIDKIDAAAVARAIPEVERAIREIDAMK